MRVAATIGAVVILSGCAAQQASTRAEAKPAAATTAQAPTLRQSPQVFAEKAGRRYIDPELGFEITRPDGAWELDAADHQSDEGLIIPVVMRHLDSGAQVVVQIAPAVASPSQFAQRLNSGLKQQPGFVATDPEPIALTDDAVGFDFTLSDKVVGKVAVLSGKTGQVFLIMATWPKGAPQEVATRVDAIFASLKPLPAT